MGETSHGENKPLSILKRQYLKTLGDTSKLLLMSDRKLHKHFRLTPRSMTLDDLELLYVRIFREFYEISQIC